MENRYVGQAVMALCLALAGCNGNDSQEIAEVCRKYPTSMTVSDESGFVGVVTTSFSTEKLAYRQVLKRIDGPQRVTQWVYPSLEAFVEETGFVSLGAHASYRDDDDILESEKRVLTAGDERLLQSVTTVTDDDGVRIINVRFDTWDGEDRPTRGFAVESIKNDPESRCDLIELSYEYDDQARQVTVRNNGGTRVDGTPCGGGASRKRYDRFRNLVGYELWDKAEDMAGAPAASAEFDVRIDAAETVCYSLVRRVPLAIGQDSE